MTSRSSRYTSRRKRAVSIVVLAAALTSLTSCGSDNATASKTTSSKATTRSTTISKATGSSTASPSGDLARYCAAAIDLDQAMQGVDPSDQKAFTRAIAAAAPAAAAAVAAAPKEVADASSTIADVIDGIVKSGDPSALAGPELTAADHEAHAFQLDQCGWTQTDITAQDFHFMGAFPTKAGPVSVEMTNKGTESHLLIIARKHDDVDGSAMDAFEGLKGEDDLPKSFDQVLTVYAEPGDNAYGLGELTAGDYVAFCPIPVGTHDGVEGSGPPHFTKGMVETFTVA